MTGDAARAVDLSAFGADARRAIAAAEAEARELGHAFVGTEHLLLGLLSDEDNPAAIALRDAGATLAATRAKVREAVGPSTVTGEPTTSSARASRALGRATRFSHQQRSPVVASEHLLEGVLDVEGTAGQVLRRLGVDVERLRARLAGTDTSPAPPTTGATEPARDVTPARCPSCDASLDEDLTWGTITATSSTGDALRDAVVFWCATCGAALGAAPA
jgi:ATP-dependent Clp protease ATP-binding subunit ClpA